VDISSLHIKPLNMTCICPIQSGSSALEIVDCTRALSSVITTRWARIVTFLGKYTKVRIQKWYGLFIGMDFSHARTGTSICSPIMSADSTYLVPAIHRTAAFAVRQSMISSASAYFEPRENGTLDARVQHHMIITRCEEF